MNDTHYNELVSLTQLYLLHEYKLEDWLCADSETYTFFKQLAASQKNKEKPVKIDTIKIMAEKPATPPSPAAINSVNEKNAIPPAPAAASSLNEKIATPPNPMTATGITEKPKPIPQSSLLQSSVASQEHGILKLEPMPSPSSVDFSEIKSLLHERFPNLKIVDDIPSKALERPKPQALVLFMNQDPASKTFLQNLTRAIDHCLAPAVLENGEAHEVKTEWNAYLNHSEIKAVILTSQTLKNLPNLSNFLANTADKIHLFELPDIAAFSKDPIQKKRLWSSLEKYFLIR